MREIIEAAGVELRYLPPYSPDINPIEQSFAKLKAHLRKARERTIPGLYDRIGKTLELFSLQNRLQYYWKRNWGRDWKRFDRLGARVRYLGMDKEFHERIRHIRGKLIGGEPADERDHFYVRKACQQAVDGRSLVQVLRHEYRSHKPFTEAELTELSWP